MKEENLKTENTDIQLNHRGEERREHNGIYDLVSLGRGRKLGKVDCPFCNSVVDCYLWSISGGGKKCKCGAVIYRTAAILPLKK